MHVEDSYEGALLRLQRLEQAGLVAAPPASAPSESDESLHARIAELEELATLACDDNDRLKRELADACEQISRLQAQVAILEARAAQPAPSAAPERSVVPETWYAPEPAVAPEPDPTLPTAAAPDFDLDGLDPDPSLSLVPRRRGALYLLVAGALVALALGLVALHPWQQPRKPLAPVVFTLPPPPPVATAPAPTPPVQPAIATPPPSAPAAAKPAPETRPTHERASRRHHAASHKHAARKHHGASHSTARKHFSETSDPLGGLDL